jgi:hypothetical protein
VPKLALQAPIPDLCPSLLVERGCVQRLRNLLKPRLRELVAVGVQETTRLLGEQLDGGALSVDGLAERGGIATAGQQVCLGLSKRVARLEQRVDLASLRAHQLIDRPRGHGRLAELGYRSRFITPSVAPKLTRQGVAPFGELLEGQSV